MRGIKAFARAGWSLLWPEARGEGKDELDEDLSFLQMHRHVRRFEVIVGQSRRLNCAVCLSAVPPSSMAKSDPSPGHLAYNNTGQYSRLIIPGAKDGSRICQLRFKTSQLQLSRSEDYPKAGLLAARYTINRE